MACSKSRSASDRTKPRIDLPLTIRSCLTVAAFTNPSKMFAPSNSPEATPCANRRYTVP
ncbi:BQ5605_C026g10253 [Microbotryum silenes-dioicae]|uniref:BQ5605_C026g10253 protein n=1 Tax=Microbotryum silenes-dioicae TaxID=796604 RepID=A0A2X0PM67_9BASI|nr:BQ5605_C026g10253 [Microbotryum silenes-dioicae]